MITDVAPGLWIWRQDHPEWHGGSGWDPPVTSTVVESGGEVVVIDPILPTEDAVWERLDANRPTVVAILKPDHIRAVDDFVERYGARAYGPFLFWRSNIPDTDLRRIDPGDALPGGLKALYDGRNRMETPLYLPEQRALVFADALTAPRGELLVWGTPWHHERVLPALRAMLDLDFEHVIVSHGEPVHDRAAFEAALERAPYADVE
jgi:hypothetical protein